MSVYLATGFSNVSFWLLYVVHFPIHNVNINLFSRPGPTQWRSVGIFFEEAKWMYLMQLQELFERLVIYQDLHTPVI